MSNNVGKKKSVTSLLMDFTSICRSYLSPSDIMRNQPHLLIIGTGFAFGYLVVRPSSNTYIKYLGDLCFDAVAL